MRKEICSSIVLASLLTACHPTEPTRTVEWFKENRPALKETLAKCNSNPGELAATPNCINASRAQGAITWGATGTGGVKVEPLTFGKDGKPNG